MDLFGKKSDKSLEERVEKLERQHRELHAEWVVWYEKAQKLLWRLVKRQEAVSDEVDPSPPAENAPQRRVDPISAKILARREARRS